MRVRACDREVGVVNHGRYLMNDDQRRKDLIIKMHNDIHMLKQVRKALNDIQESFHINNPRRAEYQVYLLRTMIGQQPSRTEPWSTYQQLVLEEFDE